jgi:hypothetical protein
MQHRSRVRAPLEINWLPARITCCPCYDMADTDAGSCSANSWLTSMGVSTGPAVDLEPTLWVDRYPANCSVTSSCVSTSDALAGQLRCRPARLMGSSSGVGSNPTDVACWLSGLTAWCSPDAAGQTTHYNHLFEFVPNSNIMETMAMRVEVRIPM